MKHYEFEISQFLDNELPADEQKNLFSHLSECDECSKTLSDLMKIKYDVRSLYDGMNVELRDSSAFISVLNPATKKRNIYKTMFYAAAAASILLGIFLFLLEGDKSSLGNKYLQLQKKSIRLQNHYTIALGEKQHLVEMNRINFDNMNLLLAKYKVRTANTLKSTNMKSSTKTIASSNQKRIPSGVIYGSIEKITKEDFLIPQIIGN